jgi:RNA polymerase sigma factor (sigma-70 family)
MSRSPGPAISGPLLRLFGEGSLIGLTEHELLDRFRTSGDEQAFEALVDRHGPMVLSVCRRVLGPGPDADDAFQATFLVLARKAGQLRSRALVGPWLHRVALRASWRAAAVARRRRRFEGPAGDALDQMVGPDVRPDPDHELLHREIDRLPASYRRVVLLCDLSGHSHSEAASLLGWPLGTVKGRHFRARELLRSRLSRLGLAVSAVTLAQAGTRASVPVGLAVKVAQAATRISYTGAAWLGISAIPAERLMKGVLVAMFIEKIKLVAVVLVPATVLGLATMAGAARWQEKDGPGPRQSPVAAIDSKAEENADSGTQQSEQDGTSPPPTDQQAVGVREEVANDGYSGAISSAERDELILALSGRWVFESIEGGRNSSDGGSGVTIIKPAPDQILSTLGAEGVPFLRYHVSDAAADPGDADPDAILIARKSKNLNLYDTYSLKSIAANPHNIRPDTGIFQREGDLLRMASTWNGVRPSSFSLVGTKNTYIITNRLVDSNGVNLTGMADDGSRRGDDPIPRTPPEEPGVSSAGTLGEPITNPLVGLWELESVDNRPVANGTYMKLIPSKVSFTSDSESGATWFVLKSISVVNGLPYTYADQIVAIGGGREGKSFNHYSTSLLADPNKPSPATRGEYRFEENGMLSIATELPNPSPGAIDPGYSHPLQVRAYRRVNSESLNVDEARPREESLPATGSPTAADLIERKEVASAMMGRTHQAIQEIRKQLDQISASGAESIVESELTKFEVELLQSEIRELEAELWKFRRKEDDPKDRFEVQRFHSLIDARRATLREYLERSAQASLKVEQTKREIERLNDELRTLYRDRKAAGDTLERQ